MAEQDTRINSLERSLDVFVQEMKDFKSEMKDFKAEMKERDRIRAEELREFNKIRAEELKDFKDEMRQQNQMRADEIAEIRKSVASIQESSKNQTIVTFLGIAAMVIAVLLK